MSTITVVGAGLAGAEAAWQLAEQGFSVTLVEQKPSSRSAAHAGDGFAELVCSNSLRSSNPMNAVGLLKEEMRRLGSLVMRVAHDTRVPAGDALAVDREAFSQAITCALREHGRISVQARLIDKLPSPDERETIVATGPLTATALAEDIAAVTGRKRLYFYDALAPVIAADSIDRNVVFSASRYGKGGGSDYLNCPLDKAEYEAFLAALLQAEVYPLHAFEDPKYFTGCLPIEVVAHSGVDALRYGAMKPVGLHDPRTDRRPYAVVQLRQEDRAGQAFNLVGFQTKMRPSEQLRVLRMLPGLRSVEILRYGAIHRNTYIDAPTLLDARMRLSTLPNVRFAGQVTGVEGYVESAAHGLVTARLLASDMRGVPEALPPVATALGGLCAHVLGNNRLPGRAHEPANVNWSMMPPPPAGTKKSVSKLWRVRRATQEFEAWAATQGVPLLPRGDALTGVLAGAGQDAGRA